MFPSFLILRWIFPLGKSEAWIERRCTCQKKKKT